MRVVDEKPEGGPRSSAVSMSLARRQRRVRRRLLIAAPGVLAAWAYPRSPRAAEIVTVKVAMSASSTHITGRMAILMGREVQRRLPGRVDWQVYAGGQLGTISETMLGLMQGTHMLTMNGGWFQGIAPEFGIFDTPFMFKDRAEAQRGIAAVQEDLARAILPKGIVLIGIGALGFRQISNNVRAVVTPADLKGIKLRIPGDAYSVETFKHLGAQPIPMDVDELYLALREGVVDGQENPLATIWTLHYYEVQRYISLSNHVFSPIFIGASAAYWERWPQDVRRAIQGAAQVACDYSFIEDERSTASLLQKIAAANPRLRINAIDRAAFARTLAPLIARRRAELAPKLLAKVDAALLHTARVASGP
jgi:TRAP-type transport system periplasmic protein